MTNKTIDSHNDALDASLSNLGYAVSPLRDSLLPGLFFLSLLGSDNKTGWPTGDTRAGAVYDYSLNKRHPSASGPVVIGQSSAVLSSSAFMQGVFTGDQLCAANNACTLFSLSKWTNGGAGGPNNYPGSLMKALGIVRTTNGHYQGIASQSGTNNVVNLNTDSNTGTTWDLIIWTVSPTQGVLYRYSLAIPGGQSASVTLSANPGGSGLIRLGCSIDTTDTAAAEHAIWGAFDHALSTTEIGYLVADLRTYCAGLAHPIGF